MNLTDRAKVNETLCAVARLANHTAAEHLQDATDALDILHSLAEFKEGQFVKLAGTPKIPLANGRHGWIGARHYLVEGAAGVIKQVWWYGGTFRYAVGMADESWLDAKGKIHPMPFEHLYHFKQKQLARWEGDWVLPPELCSCGQCSPASPQIENP